MFIEAIERIVKRKDLRFCSDDREREGKWPSICVYQNDEFIGKIRFADSKGTFNPSVDESLLVVLDKKE